MLCPPDATVASAHTDTSPAESAMLDARKPGLIHSSCGDRRPSRLSRSCPARKSSASASIHLIAPIAMSDGAGPGTEFAASTDEPAPEIPTSKVKLPVTRWPSNALTVVQSTV